MKSKLTHHSGRRFLYTICVIAALGLFATKANAQVQASVDHQVVSRDSSGKVITYITRSQFNAMSYPQQIEFLTHSVPFKVSDLDNTNMRDFLRPLPNETFITSADFYTAPVQKQQLILTDPVDWKVYN